MKGWSKSRFELPEALAMEILLKLPVKSLCRFNCVLSLGVLLFEPLISFPNIIITTLKATTLISSLDVVLLSLIMTSLISLNFQPKKTSFYLVKQNIHLPFFENISNPPPYVYGPCHGFLCLCDYTVGEPTLWNPSTREFKILPQSSVQPPPSPGYISFQCLGFGFDSKTDDYKVIQFVTLVFLDNEYDHPLPDLWYQFELYSLKSDTWKEISVPNPFPFGNHLCNNYVDGICYWEARDLHDRYILSFDMANEKFSTLPFPEFGRSLAQDCVVLLEFKGSLGVIVYPWEGTEKSFDLWVMNGAWTKQFSIESVSGVVKPSGF